MPSQAMYQAPLNQAAEMDSSAWSASSTCVRVKCAKSPSPVDAILMRPAPVVALRSDQPGENRARQGSKYFHERVLRHVGSQGVAPRIAHRQTQCPCLVAADQGRKRRLEPPAGEQHQLVVAAALEPPEPLGGRSLGYQRYLGRGGDSSIAIRPLPTFPRIKRMCACSTATASCSCCESEVTR